MFNLHQTPFKGKTKKSESIAWRSTWQCAAFRVFISVEQYPIMHTQKCLILGWKESFWYGYTVALKIAHARLTAPCFIKVISQASEPDGILTRFQFGLPRQVQNNYYRRNSDKIVCNLAISDLLFISIVEY